MGLATTMMRSERPYAHDALEVFAEITRKVIGDGDFSEFLPTVLYPERRQLSALEGVPADAEIESVAVAWAAEGAVDDEDFLVAFRVSDTQFKIVRRSGGHFDSKVFGVLG